MPHRCQAKFENRRWFFFLWNYLYSIFTFMKTKLKMANRLRCCKINNCKNEYGTKRFFFSSKQFISMVKKKYEILSMFADAIDFYSQRTDKRGRSSKMDWCYRNDPKIKSWNPTIWCVRITLSSRKYKSWKDQKQIEKRCRSIDFPKRKVNSVSFWMAVFRVKCIEIIFFFG